MMLASAIGFFLTSCLFSNIGCMILRLKENFKDVPTWAKFINLPLCCWSEYGISKIAFKIGIPLMVDPLTTRGTHLTFARMSIQVNVFSALSSLITILVKGADIV